MGETFQVYSAAQDLRSGGREAVRLALLAARERTLAIAADFAAALDPVGLAVPYSAALNPPLWEWGHVGWFQEYWIARNRERSLGVACDPDHRRDASLLARADDFYDSSRVAHRSRWELPMPDSADTFGYLAATLAQTLDVLDRLPADAGDDDLYFFRLVAVHEAMHAEAACYMARTLNVPLALPAESPMRGAAEVLAIPAQQFRVGYDSGGFAFDNELGGHEVHLDAFEIDAQPVLWSQFHEFVEAGGLRDKRWWDDEGWAWLQSGSSRVTAVPLHPQTAATHLSAYEAEAWCRWAGRRLPTEAEWECTAITAPGFSWGQAWEWTASVFQPYPGFRPHPYRDYSQPWFGTRRVLRGACPVTADWLAHPRYRNFFEPGRSDIFAGFRSCA